MTSRLDHDNPDGFPSIRYVLVARDRVLVAQSVFWVDCREIVGKTLKGEPEL
jgi:hypothetical protein